MALHAGQVYVRTAGGGRDGGAQTGWTPGRVDLHRTQLVGIYAAICCGAAHAQIARDIYSHCYAYAIYLRDPVPQPMRSPDDDVMRLVVSRRRSSAAIIMNSDCACRHTHGIDKAIIVVFAAG